MHIAFLGVNVWNLGFDFSLTSQEKANNNMGFYDSVCTESSVTEDRYGDTYRTRSTEHMGSDVRLFIFHFF